MAKNNNPRKIDFHSFYEQKTSKERISFLLQFAVLAPSTHNSQPWLFKINEDYCDIYFEPKLQIPKADPEGRDLHISIGCATQNLALAAKAYDVFGKIEIGPFKDKTHLTRVTFKNLLKTDRSICDQDVLKILLRRINARGRFLKKEVPDSLLNSLREIADEESISINFLTNTRDIKSIANFTAEGIEFAYADKEFRKEMSGWMHSSLTSKKTGIPGYALKMPHILSFVLPTMIRFINIGKKLGQLNRLTINSAPVVSIISTKEDNATNWIRVGIAAEKMMVEVNKHSLHTSIYVASIEMGDVYKKVQAMTGLESRPQFIFVIGQIDSVHKPTPRLPLKEKIL